MTWRNGLDDALVAIAVSNAHPVAAGKFTLFAARKAAEGFPAIEFYAVLPPVRGDNGAGGVQDAADEVGER